MFPGLENTDYFKFSVNAVCVKQIIFIMSDKAVLVIGGSGFLGSHVADALTHAGFHVRVFDKTASQYVSDKQEMIVGDLLDDKKLFEAVKGCEAVYNFAAIADLNDALDNPMATVKINILGNALALEACRMQNVKRFIYASTVYVHSREGGFYRCSKHRRPRIRQARTQSPAMWLRSRHARLSQFETGGLTLPSLRPAISLKRLNV